MKCDTPYMGKTNKRVSVRLEEHKHVAMQSSSTSSLANHVIKTGYQTNFDKTITMAKMEHLTSKGEQATKKQRPKSNINITQQLIAIQKGKGTRSSSQT